MPTTPDVAKQPNPIQFFPRCPGREGNGGTRPAAATHERPTKERDAAMNVKRRHPEMKK